jgi:6-phosphogluconolactonase
MVAGYLRVSSGPYITLAFVACAGSGEVVTLALNEASGSMRIADRLLLGGQIMPLALSSQGRVLFAARRSDPMSVLALRVQPQAGTLTVISETPVDASFPHLAVDASGRWLLAASYQQGLLAVFGIQATGEILPAHQVLHSGAKTHALRTTPDNTSALAAVLGTDQVLRYTFDEISGSLSAPEVIRMPTGSGPRHLALHPSDPTGRIAWVLGELDGQVRSLDGRHAASVLPRKFEGTPWAADLRLAPNGQHLYASERSSSTLTLLEVDAATGAVCTLGSWPTQVQPRGFAITGSGRWLLCAGQRSHAVSLHRIAIDGSLELAGEISVGEDPNWIECFGPSDGCDSA